MQFREQVCSNRSTKLYILLRILFIIAGWFNTKNIVLKLLKVNKNNKRFPGRKSVNVVYKLEAKFNI